LGAGGGRFQRVFHYECPPPVPDACSGLSRAMAARRGSDH
jgi:hypothetical protein